MALTSVVASDMFGNSMRLGLASSESVYIRVIEGLGPSKMTINTEIVPGLEGVRKTSSTRGGRDINMTLQFDESVEFATVAELRRRVYRIFQTGNMVRLLLKQDDVTDVYVEGEVEECVPTRFVKDPGVNIIIRCFDADLLDPLVMRVERTLGTTTSLPFDLINNGDRPVGFELTVIRQAAAAMSKITLDVASPFGRNQRAVFDVNLINGQGVIVNTSPGTRSVGLASFPTGDYRTPVDYKPWVQALNEQSEWPLLYPGESTITLRGNVAGTLDKVVFVYQEQYGGI